MLVRRKIRVRKNVALRQHAPKFSMAAKNLLRLRFERGECAAILGKLLTELGEKSVSGRTSPFANMRRNFPWPRKIFCASTSSAIQYVTSRFDMPPPHRSNTPRAAPH